MIPTRTPDFSLDANFILTDTTDSIKQEGTLVGLSKVPNLHGTTSLSSVNEHQIERIQDDYNPLHKEDQFTLYGYEGATFTQIRKHKYDTRNDSKSVVQHRSKIGDSTGRTSRPSTHYSRKQQARFRNELEKINTTRIQYRPYFITLTTTNYIHELRQQNQPGIVADFCKDGLKRLKSRLRRHDQYRHLTGLYKWEHTKSELPHLHWLCWFARWDGAEDTPENKMIDYKSISEMWFECLFPTEELREANYKHLEAGTQTEPIRGKKKRFPSKYTTEQLENDLSQLREQSNEEKRKGFLIAGNYVSKYIGKEETNVPDGWRGTFTGVINKHAFKSFQDEVIITFNDKKDGQKVWEELVKSDNQRITEHVKRSKDLQYIIKRVENQITISSENEIQALTEQAPIKLLGQNNDLETDLERRYLKHWNTEDRQSSVVVKQDKDNNDYVTEFIDSVYDSEGNYIGKYEAVNFKELIPSDKLVSNADFNWIKKWNESDEPPNDDLITQDHIIDLADRLNYELEHGVAFNATNKDGSKYKETIKYVLHDQGDIVEIHDNWNDIKARRIANENEWKYKTSKYLRGTNYRDILQSSFPNSAFVQTNREERNISLDVNNFYHKKEIKICLSITELPTTNKVETQKL